MTTTKSQRKANKKVRRKVAKAMAQPAQKAAKRAKRRTRRQKRSAGVGVAFQATNVMRPMRSTTARDGHMCRFRGTDFLTAVTIGGSAAAAGDVLYTAVVNPKTLGISRLATVSQLWERYKFRSLKFRYAPVAPTTTAGQLIGYVDYDTYDDPTGISGVQNLQRAAAHFGEKPVQVWQGQEKPVFWEIKDIDPLTDLYVDSDGTDPRWTNQGRFVLLAASAIAGSTACGNIYLDYDIEFYIPQLEQTPISGYSWQITAGGAMSAAAPFGASPVLATGNNLPLVQSGAVVSFPAGGSYLVSYTMVGTVLSPTTYGWTASAAASFVGAKSGILTNAGATTITAYMMVVATGAFTLTSNITATTVTSMQMSVAQISSTAVSLTQRKLTQLSRVLQLVGDVEALKRTVSDLADVESSSEGKECKIQPSGATASMSALASGNMGSASSKTPLIAEDGYFVVKRGSRTA